MTTTVSGAPLLQVDDLHVAYGKIEAVTGVNLKVGEGQIVTVIGPNGAGKTTLLSAIMGHLPATGAIGFAGAALNGTPIKDRIGQGLALVPETRALFSSMSVENNLELGAFRFHHRPVRERQATMEEMYALFPRLRERRAQRASTLSGGERQMLALARALMGKPRLLMLDEPSLGLAPLIVREVFRIISALRDSGVSILLVEQNARAALRVADYAYVLELGRVAAEGPAAELATDPRVVAAYLGMNSKHQERLAR